jgi:hypothetical protein
VVAVKDDIRLGMRCAAFLNVICYPPAAQLTEALSRRARGGNEFRQTGWAKYERVWASRLVHQLQQLGYQAVLTPVG